MRNQKSLTSVISAVLNRDERLFSGPWIRWNVLTIPERVVCGCVLLSPIWWFLGWTYSLLFISVGIISYTRLRGESLNLKSPSWNVIFLIAFQLYRSLSTIVASSENSPSQFISLFLGLFVGFIFWYIESNNIQIRTKVLGWALSVLSVEMLVFWIIIQGIFSSPFFIPPRTLFSQIMDKSERYIPGSGASNYLIPYWPEDKLLGGFSRFSFFFPFPEDFALLTGLISLLALDLKNRFWRWPLFGVGIFLMFLSGTRSTWLILPIVLICRYLIIAGQRWGSSLLLGLVGTACFISLSFSPVTDYLTDAYTLISESTGNMRKDSTEVRSLIYKRTQEAIIEEPSDFLLGRGVPGPTVLPGYEPAKIGSHSFILGTLFYRTGIIGTMSFLGFWITYTLKIYKTRSKRPICALLMILYLSLALLSMDVSMINYILILGVMLNDVKSPLDYQFRGRGYGKI